MSKQIRFGSRPKCVSGRAQFIETKQPADFYDGFATGKKWWSEFALAGIMPRSVPEMFSDQEIQNWIMATRASERLPWEMSNEGWDLP
jgi:hypothetical protein